MKEYLENLEDCEYLEEVYLEYDTGYREYECLLFGGDCLGDNCPLNFRCEVRE